MVQDSDALERDRLKALGQSLEESNAARAKEIVSLAYDATAQPIVAASENRGPRAAAIALVAAVGLIVILITVLFLKRPSPEIRSLESFEANMQITEDGADRTIENSGCGAGQAGTTQCRRRINLTYTSANDFQTALGSLRSHGWTAINQGTNKYSGDSYRGYCVIVGQAGPVAVGAVNQYSLVLAYPDDWQCQTF